MFTYSLKSASEIRKFYVAVEHQQLRNGQKNVINIQKLLFCLYKCVAFLPFWLSSPWLLLKLLIVVIQEFCKLPWQCDFINTKSSEKVMRVNKMMPKEKILWSVIKFSQQSRKFSSLYNTVMVTFFHIFTHADIVNAQTWEVSTLNNPVEPP